MPSAPSYGFALLLMSLALVGCERRAATPLAAEEEGDRPDQISWDVQFLVSENGLPRVHVVAPYMERYERDDRSDSTYALLQPHPDSTRGRVVAYLFNEVGDSSATLVANRLLYFENAGRFEAFGDVVVTTQDDKRLETEALTWLEELREVRTDGFARITTPTEQIQGYQLVADEDLEPYTLARITGQATVEE